MATKGLVLGKINPYAEEKVDIGIEANKVYNIFCDGSGYKTFQIKIVPFTQRKEPFGPCFVLWLKYEAHTRITGKPTIFSVEGFLCIYNILPEPLYCREWKTLKGIVGYIESRYGKIDY